MRSPVLRSSVGSAAMAPSQSAMPAARSAPRLASALASLTRARAAAFSASDRPAWVCAMSLNLLLRWAEPRENLVQAAVREMSALLDGRQNLVALLGRVEHRGLNETRLLAQILELHGLAPDHAAHP